jgi:hypothetical protein
MKIEAYSVQAASSWKFRSEDIEIKSVKQRIHVGEPPAERTGAGGRASTVTLELSEDAKKLIQSLRSAYDKTEREARVKGGRASDPADSPRSYALEIRKSILEAFIYRLTGKKFVFKSIDLGKDARRTEAPAEGAVPLDKAGFEAAPQGRHVVTRSEFYASHYESESLNYEAKALVRTADGRSISVEMSLNMSRELFTSAGGAVSYAETSNFVDPLVINFSGTAASLTERKFEFDLDADGALDNISFAGEGSGFLALDKNEDGLINDGSELFGPRGGSGFDELRAYDLDGNGWIDENDAVFSKLRVWSKDADGNDMLFTLKEADVGAIFLGDVSTRYTLGSDGGVDGMMRSTSMFLKESGGAGLISHIDLAV